MLSALVADAVAVEPPLDVALPVVGPLLLRLLVGLPVRCILLVIFLRMFAAGGGARARATNGERCEWAGTRGSWADEVNATGWRSPGCVRIGEKWTRKVAMLKSAVFVRVAIFGEKSENISIRRCVCGQWPRLTRLELVPSPLEWTVWMQHKNKPNRAVFGAVTMKSV